MSDRDFAQNTAEAVYCPADNQRLATQEQPVTPPIDIDADGVWHVHGYDEARQILRHEAVKQAGFSADMMDMGAGSVMKNKPILYLEGEEHHRMRRETNRFFTPSITDKHHRTFMETVADELIVDLQQKGRADLSDITMEMALRVASQIVGLTDSLLPGLKGRLSGMMDMSSQLTSAAPQILKIVWGQRHMVAFLMLDVKPSIRARRKNPQDDVISYLISREYSDIEILTECVVYGVAGMITTREFICVALWQLLSNPHLRQRMLVGSQEERYAILHEILRLESVIGHLYRRTTAEFEIRSDGQQVTIPTNTLIDLNLYAANADTRMAGDNAGELCPMRPLTSELGKVPEYVMGFGDGYHRCPGSFVAIQESDIFLRKLLAIETLRLEETPDVTYNELVKGYEIRNFTIVV